MTLTPSVRAMSLCSLPCVAKSLACASLVAISALECFFFLAIEVLGSYDILDFSALVGLTGPDLVFSDDGAAGTNIDFDFAGNHMTVDLVGVAFVAGVTDMQILTSNTTFS